MKEDPVDQTAGCGGAGHARGNPGEARERHISRAHLRCERAFSEGDFRHGPSEPGGHVIAAGKFTAEQNPQRNHSAQVGDKRNALPDHSDLPLRKI